jgi:mannose-6-phosphate isomerase-like protein (cupin superfamily)
MEEYFKRFERQWGYYECIIPSISNYQVKRLTVFPGKSTSIQRHQHRRESWTVVSGEGKALIDRMFRNIEIGSVVSVDMKVVHQIINNGDKNLILIEVQTGEYLGEDDITRYNTIPE